MTVVLDASVPLTWFFGKGDVASAHAIAERIRDRLIVVPQLWPLEIANGFATALRNKLVSSEWRDDAISQLRELSVEIDGKTNDHAWTTTSELADRYALTAYDAAYLELAIRRHLPLATLDRQLAEAADKAEIELLR